MSTLTILLIVLILLILLLLYLLWARLNYRWPYHPAYPKTEYYIKDEIVVSGGRTEVEGFETVLRNARFTVETLDTMNFNDLGLMGICPPGKPDYIIRLSRVKGGWDRALETIANMEGVTAFSELNRITGAPWDPEPSPWDPEPSPWDPEPSGVNGPTDKDAEAKDTDFFDQWAFHQIGLVNYTQLIDVPRGKGVKVAIFDTSPYPDPANPGDFRSTVVMAKPFPELSLTVRHARQYSNLPATKRQHDLRSHGLFVAGMAHAVAPASQIRLVRVLEQDRRGSMYTLMRAIFDFLLEEVVNDPAAKNHAVINLSLGVRIPPDVPEAQWNLRKEKNIIFNPLEALGNIVKAAGCLGVLVVAASGNDSDQSSKPLEMNFPAVLSTGPNINPPPRVLEGVSRLDYVLGVASNTSQLRRSCFSNWGSIAAPGGQGESRPFIPPDISGRLARSLFPLIRMLNPSKSRFTPEGGALKNISNLGQRITIANCLPHRGLYQRVGNVDNTVYGVVGPVYPLNWANPAQVTPVYRYWAGTSFATPLVSGMASLVMSCGYRNLTPAEVREQIECNVRVPPGDQAVRPNGKEDGLGMGIICITPEICQQGTIKTELS